MASIDLEIRAFSGRLDRCLDALGHDLVKYDIDRTRRRDGDSRDEASNPTALDRPTEQGMSHLGRAPEVIDRSGVVTERGLGEPLEAGQSRGDAR